MTPVASAIAITGGTRTTLLNVTMLLMESIVSMQTITTAAIFQLPETNPKRPHLSPLPKGPYQSRRKREHFSLTWFRDNAYDHTKVQCTVAPTERSGSCRNMAGIFEELSGKLAPSEQPCATVGLRQGGDPLPPVRPIFTQGPPFCVPVPSKHPSRCHNRIRKNTAPWIVKCQGTLTPTGENRSG